jgi:hypothetical protein
MRSTNVWVLPDIAEWRESFIEMIDEIHSFSDLCKRLRACDEPLNDENYVDKLNLILSEIKDYEFYFIELMNCKFRSRYSFIRAVHLSKPIDVDDVLTKGLLVFSIDSYMEKAKSIFLNGDYPSVAELNVGAAVKKVIADDPTRENKLYFFATEFYQYCPAYAKFGSEFMVAVAENLNVNDQYKINVEKKGAPTVFVCKVPIENVCRLHIRDCLRIATFQLFKPSMGESTSLKKMDICFSIDAALMPLNIVSHHYYF